MLSYFFPVQKVDQKAKIEISPVDHSSCAQFTQWGKWLVRFPITLIDRLYTTYLMIREGQILKPIKTKLISGNVIHPLSTLKGPYQMHIITSSALAAAIFKLPRSNHKGLFLVGERGPNTLLLLSPIRDLFKGEVVELNDFLLTCESERVSSYREAIHHVIAPHSLPDFQEHLRTIADHGITYLQRQEKEGKVRCSVREFVGAFNAASIIYLFLRKETIDFGKCLAISQATIVCTRDAFMKFAGKNPDSNQMKQYEEALQILREISEKVEPIFVDRLSHTSLTSIQKKILLFVLLTAGNDTTASLTEYLMWQLGEHREYQENICREKNQNLSSQNTSLEGLIKEGLRLHPPAPFIGRTARVNLTIQVKNSESPSWSYLINRGDELIISPYFIARDPNFCSNPSDFTPDRKEFARFSSHTLPSHPFGRGIHKCPGESLARKVIGCLIETLLFHYQIEKSSEPPPTQKSHTTLFLDPKVEVTLIRKESQT